MNRYGLIFRKYALTDNKNIIRDMSDNKDDFGVNVGEIIELIYMHKIGDEVLQHIKGRFDKEQIMDTSGT